MAKLLLTYLSGRKAVIRNGKTENLAKLEVHIFISYAFLNQPLLLNFFMN